jgi:hypothetical protein
MERAEQEAKNRGCAAVALYTIIFLSDVITNADRWHKRFAFDGGITRRHPVREGGPVQPVDERSPNASIVQRARSDVCVVIELRDLYQDAIARPVRWLGVRRRKE